ncbi:MAG: sulfatase/phosphatase domain-containing protein, partial [Planctomycetota bacterium]|jgi:iduronate 2-sulfatase
MALWEESTRVPLAFCVPGMETAGKTSSRPVSLIDVYPTLIELCRLDRMEGLEGVSLAPLLGRPDLAWDRPALTTWHYGNHSVRSEHYRYIRYRDGTEELYDHRSDPGEHTNLAGEPGMRRVIAEHRRWLPLRNKPPAGEEVFTGDSVDRKVEMLKTEGLPEWLR